MMTHRVMTVLAGLVLSAAGTARADSFSKMIGSIEFNDTGWPNEYFANARQIVRRRSGTLIAAYCRVPSGEDHSVIGYAVSTDLGQSWTSYRLTDDADSTGYDQFDPSFAVDSMDTLHAVWCGKSASYPNAVNIRYARKPKGDVWRDYSFVTTDWAAGSDNAHPAIAVGEWNSCKVWVAWDRSGSGTSVRKVWYSSKLCSYTSWPLPTQLLSSDYSRYAPSIAVDDGGVLHVTWHGKKTSSDHNHIYYIKLDGDIERCASNFSSLYAHDQYNPCLALMRDGYTPAIAFLGYDDAYPNNIFGTMPLNVHVTYGDPDSWVHKRMSDENQIYQYPPSIGSSHDSSTAITVAWGAQTCYPDNDVYQGWYRYYNDSGEEWSSLVDLMPSVYEGNIMTSLLWSNWPIFNGKKSNVPYTGFPLMAVNKQDDDTFNLNYWYSYWWSWEDTDPTPTPYVAPNTPTPATQPSPTPAPTPVPNRVISGDYDGDGYADCAVFRPSSGLWAVYGLTRFYFGTSTDVPASGDYNGDGTTEAAIYRASTGLWAIRDLPRAYLGGASDVPVPADYDDDGTDDPAVFRPSSGLWAVRDLTRAYFGGVGDTPLAFRVLPSARREFCVWSPADGSWAVRNFTRCYLGRKGDVPVPEDYNGLTYKQDEVAIFRPDNGFWSILNYTSIYFGAKGDNPVPAQYAPGLSTYKDLAIFRPSTGLWSVRSYTNRYLGAATDKPVTR
jgi:hypothetical protein